MIARGKKLRSDFWDLFLHQFGSTEEFNHVPNDHHRKPSKQTQNHVIHFSSIARKRLGQIFEMTVAVWLERIFAARRVQLNGRLELVSMERLELVVTY